MQLRLARENCHLTLSSKCEQPREPKSATARGVRPADHEQGYATGRPALGERDCDCTGQYFTDLALEVKRELHVRGQIALPPDACHKLRLSFRPRAREAPDGSWDRLCHRMFGFKFGQLGV